MPCQIAYEPAFSLWFPSLGLLLAGFAVIVSRFVPRPGAIFSYVVAGLGLLWALGAGATVYASHAEARRAANSPSTPAVEGIVENFHPAPYEGHEDESFDVNGHRFAYSDYVITGGFRQTSSHGGPIREGLHVRVRYVPSETTDLESRSANLIVKLEVCTP